MRRTVDKCQPCPGGFRAQYRYRIQSLKTGWGVEAEPSEIGKKQLVKIRKEHPDKFKFCRVYMAKQMLPFHHACLEPFRLTSRKDREVYYA